MHQLAKPSVVARKHDRWKQRQDSDKAKREAKRKAENDWRVLSKLIEARDGGRCRICGARTVKPGGDPELIGAAHHVIFRSAQGPSIARNLIWVDALCHERIHSHQIDVTGTADKLKVVHR